MGEKPTDDSAPADETAKLELPSLSLRRRGRGKSHKPADVEEPARDATITEPLPVDSEPQAAPVQPTSARTPERVSMAPAVEAEPGTDTQPPDRRRPTLPHLPGWLVALFAGLVVGGFGATLTYVSLRGCDAVKGTESCGGTGLFLLLIILVLMVLLGGLILALLQLPDPRATSFLAVGVLCVVVLLTLMGQLISPWMFLVVPIVSAASYVLSHGVTTALVEPTPERGPQHDVR